MRQPLLRRGEASLVLYHIELGDPIERRFGDGRLGRLPHVEDGPAAMSPAGDLGDCRHPTGRRLCRVRRALRRQTQTGSDHRGGLLEPWPAPLLRAGRPAQSAAGGRGGPAHRGDLRHRAQDQWPIGRRPAGGAAEGNQAARRRSRKIDARRTRPAVAPRRDRPGDRLYADPLAGLHPLPRRRPHLPQQQRRRTRITWNCLRAPRLAVRGLRSRRRTRRGDIHADRDGQANDIDPQAWLADVLRRIADHPASRLAELLPWNWRAGPATLAA